MPVLSLLAVHVLCVCVLPVCCLCALCVCAACVLCVCVLPVCCVLPCSLFLFCISGIFAALETCFKAPIFAVVAMQTAAESLDVTGL